MLINHMAKRHPQVPLDSIPELTLPILRSQRDFYCQYCDKVYKSSSKRKAHITKSHPGAELPAGAKRRGSGPLGTTDASSPNPTYSATVGSVISVPHACVFCHKQYSTKAKLLQHIRAKHHEETEQSQNEAANSSTLVQLQGAKMLVNAGNSTASKVLMISRHGTEIQLIPQGMRGVPGSTTSSEMTDTDILTQAMTELTQSFGSEYRVVATTQHMGANEYHTILPCVVNMAPGATLLQSLPGIDQDTGYATTLLQQRGDQQQQQQAGVSVAEAELNASSAYCQSQNINWNVLTGSSSFQAF